MRKTVYIIGVIFLLFGGHYIFKTAKVKNVFDEMYYAEIQTVPMIYTSTSFSNLIKVGKLKNLSLNMKNEYPHFKQEIYTKESLEENEYIIIVFNTDEENLRINGIKDYGEEGLRYTVIYHLESQKLILGNVEIVSDRYRETDYSTNDPNEFTKFMHENNLTEEDLVDYQNYFLYEKVLSDWFSDNPKSRFSMDDLGDVEIDINKE